MERNNMKMKVIDVHPMLSDIDLSCKARLLVVQHPITDGMIVDLSKVWSYFWRGASTLTLI